MFKPAKPIRALLTAPLLSLPVVLSGCEDKSAASTSTATTDADPVTELKTNPSEAPSYSYEVVNTFPHDTNAFTQGLVFLNGVFLESTGLNGESTLRKVDVKTGAVLKQIQVPPQYFAEGMTVLNGKI